MLSEFRIKSGTTRKAGCRDGLFLEESRKVRDEGGRWRPTAGRFFASLKNDSGTKAGSRRGLQVHNEPQGEGS